jgi:hypothetical protein
MDGACAVIGKKINQMEASVICIICGEPTGLSEKDLDHHAPVCDGYCNQIYHEGMDRYVAAAKDLSDTIDKENTKANAN